MKYPPTAEQKSAIEVPLVKGELTLLEARAGTGKTTTLELIAEANPGKSFLYLCFNRANKLEAEKRMPFNVICSTTHGLAYQTHGKKYAAAQFFNLTPWEACKLIGSRTPFDGYQVNEVLARWTQSSARTFQEIDLSQVERVHKGTLPAAIGLWNRKVDVNDTDARMDHDGYLKLWALSDPVLNKRDVILVDEAQDLNPAMLGVLLRQLQNKTCAVVMVGDTAQGIYGWRGAVNAMESCRPSATHRCSLTESFRFGPLIAARASRILKERGINEPLIGRGTKKTISTKGYLTRTNAALIAAAIETPGPKHFAATSERDHYSPFKIYRFNDTLDVLEISRKQKFNVKSPRLKAYKDYAELRSYAYELGPDGSIVHVLDPELAAMVQLVDNYGDRLPQIVEQLCREAVGPIPGVQTFSTAHRSKGLEWDHVTVSDGFIPLWDPGVWDVYPRDDRETIEEINLLYVAITRGAVEVTLPPLFEEWFNRDKATKR